MLSHELCWAPQRAMVSTDRRAQLAYFLSLATVLTALSAGKQRFQGHKEDPLYPPVATHSSLFQ